MCFSVVEVRGGGGICVFWENCKPQVWLIQIRFMKNMPGFLFANYIQSYFFLPWHSHGYCLENTPLGPASCLFLLVAGWKYHWPEGPSVPSLQPPVVLGHGENLDLAWACLCSLSLLILTHRLGYSIWETWIYGKTSPFNFATCLSPSILF